ncbi:MarR family winged helix-turn-helix transcriptional regulator [Pseudodonghicola flavimaris]|uniref:MarR family transcriptional regulator n=1 Tax=Pseudodonghicola flavimaris TaxID=3050036 RepID=A0ABT7F2B3_9RHOB|nr:MarR family transcriptional regulator [Pseudodonghicola flavimaris]MDK3018746.1 MarR family transcriptional regulator [Pseudodonghicola flavimaris]
MSLPSLPLVDDDKQVFVEGEASLTERQQAETRFWLQVLKVHRLIFDDLNSALIAGAGLSIAKFDVLAQLYRFRDGLSMSELSTNLKVTNGNVSGLIARLQKDGYVSKTVAETDRRSFRATITDEGIAVFQKAVQLHRGETSRKLRNISLQEIEDMANSMRHLAEEIRNAEAEDAEKG